MNREHNVNYNLYTITEDGNVFSKTKGEYLSNNNAHPYVINEYVTKSGKGDSFQRHRIIWYYFNGEIPVGMHIDHINGNKQDNRLSNLRCVTPYTNTHNENTYINFLNAVRSEEHRAKISKASLGRKMSEERYKKCEPTMFKEGHTTSQEIRNKISDSNSKPTLQLDKNDTVISEWKSASEAARELGFNSSSINKCCTGGYFDKKRNKWVNITQYKDFKWMYKSDYEEKMLEELTS